MWQQQTLFLVVFPVDRNQTAKSSKSFFSRRMLYRAFELAKGLHPEPCLIAWDALSDSCYNLVLEKFVRIRPLYKKKKRLVAVNIGFLLQPVDTCRFFLDQPDDASRRLYADISAGEILAAEFPVNQIDHFPSRSALQYMIRTCDETEQKLPEQLDSWRVFKPSVSCGNSHWFSGLQTTRTRPHPMSSIYLNTAYRELIYAICGNNSSTDDNPLQLIRHLSAHEKTSRVPWIFNTLINEIEYFTGQHKLISFPPEVHISISGACSLECKFCTYEHSNSRTAYLDLSHFKKAMPLERMHTLRLTSGLGEPTLNPHLPEIIRWISSAYPHIILNFFTNGLMLNHPFLISELAGNVRWINISLNAATSAIWHHLCGRDMFDRLIGNIKKLNAQKKANDSLLPILHGSMVINSFNVHELPKMPGLCHQLGIDKFTVIPFYSMNMRSLKKLRDDNTLEFVRHQYDLLYEDTVLAAKHYGISIELPRSAHRLSVRFGLEQRDFYDFCGIGEPLPYGVHHLLPDQSNYNKTVRQCPDLWRQLLISHTYRNLVGFDNYTHFRYPCLGPMCYSDYSVTSGVNPRDSESLLSLNNHLSFKFLRKSQFQAGINAVCDLCRGGSDSRNPGTHAQFLEQLNGGQTCISEKLT